MNMSKSELDEIMQAYGCEDFSYDGSLLVEPDTELFFYHDQNDKKYLLLIADYLGVFEFEHLPYILKFDYYRRVEYTIVRELPVVNNDGIYMLDNSLLFEYKD